MIVVDFLRINLLWLPILIMYEYNGGEESNFPKCVPETRDQEVM